MSNKREELKSCFCGGMVELLNTQRHLKQRTGQEAYELVCIDCELVISLPGRSTHKLIKKFNSRPDTKLIEALGEIMSYTKLGTGSISSIRAITGKALAAHKERIEK